MPAINVAKTDTFEIQRQKINQIGDQIFNISQGGSDLSTGNLKLGDGTRTAPSLAFISDPGLGIYKADLSTFGFVSNGKKIADYSESNVYTFKDLIIQQNIIETNGVSIQNAGQNYDPGSYDNVVLLGGTGSNATANITVTEFDGVVNNSGSNYIEGSYEDINLIGGSSDGAVVSFVVEGLDGFISDSGSGYIPGNYTNVNVTGGSGTGAVADITIEGNVTINGTISSSGSGYTQGTYEQVQLITKPVETFIVTSIGSTPNRLYQINGITQDSLTLVKGNVYRFDVSSSTNAANPITFTDSSGQFLNFQDYSIIQKGVSGQSGGFVDLIIRETAPTETILYDSLADPGGGGTISVVDGVIGSFGTNMNATLTINASGNIESVEITSDGENYKEGDILEIYNGDLDGNGSGFEYTLITPTYEGEITAIDFQNNGQNYLNNDLLSANSSDLGGEGSGFSYRVTSNPGIIQNLQFSSKDINYSINDILSLPEEITNIQATLKGQVSNVSTTLDDTSPIITVASTSGILDGMQISVDLINSTGDLSIGTTVLSVDSSTQLTLSQNPSVAGEAFLNFSSQGDLTEVEVSSVENIIIDSFITKISGTGQISADTTVTSIDSENNIITLSEQPLEAGTATVSFIPPFGVPSNKFEYEILSLGSIEDFEISFGGNGYSESDILTVNNKDLTEPIEIGVINKNLQTITFVENIADNIFSVNDTIIVVGELSPTPLTIYKITTSGGFIESILVDSNNFETGDIITGDSVSTTNYEISTASEIKFRYFLDSGSGYELTPNLTFYVGNTYNFDLSDSSNSSHRFALSRFRDGFWSPSLIENKTTNLSTSSNQIAVDDATGILSGMEVSVTEGQGTLELSTVVLSVNLETNIITLDKNPTSDGEVTLTFRGTEYLESVERTDNILSIKVLETTPNLYYYCSISDDTHQNEGGEDNEEALITVNQNNPKVFGSNFSLIVSDLITEDVIKGDVATGEFSAVSFIGSEATFDSFEVLESLTSPSIISDSITLNSLLSENDLSLTASNVNISANLNVGSNVQITNSSGNITTSGVLRTNNLLNVNNFLTISNNNISSLSDSNIILTPSSGKVAKVNTSTALTIPSGNTSQRPDVDVVENGSIRFNTDTNQYEGYSESSLSWSSLGGVRDLDGNTYILAEETVGANDNTLWFINDNINTIKFTPQYQEFVNVKKLRSVNTSAPDYENWTANTPVTIGDYLKYRNNIYEVIIGGTTASSGNEPTDTTGNSFTNGSATLQYFTTAVAPLTFEEISELRVDPLGFTDLVVNGELRFSNNVISTDISDLLIRPNSGQKVTVDSNTSLVIPVGDNNSRGNAARGSIRFNTSILQYEGYDGTNWSSLGGVRDVDGNTYIIPELSPGSNENTLFFYNNNENTLRVTTTQVELDTIDTFASVTSDVINFNAATLTFDSLATTLDNTSSTETFLFSTKENFDFGLSVGLTTDPLVRLTTDGEIFYNSGFGTGVYNGLRLLDGDLKQFELSDVKLVTFKTTLDKGTINQGAAILYNPSIHESAKVQIVAHNTTTGDKEFIEYSVVDNGTDIFYTDFGNIKTGEELISTLFDFNASNEVRVTFIANTDLTNGDQIDVTVVSNIIKR